MRANYRYRLPPCGPASYHFLAACDSLISSCDVLYCVHCTTLVRNAIAPYPALQSRSLLCCQLPCSAYPLSSTSIPPFPSLSRPHSSDNSSFCSSNTDHLLLDKSNRLCSYHFHTHLTFDYHSTLPLKASPLTITHLLTPAYQPFPTFIVLLETNHIASFFFNTHFILLIRTATMPPVRTMTAPKPLKTERTHEENQERFVFQSYVLLESSLTRYQSLHRRLSPK